MQSMTGFGRGDATSDDYRVSIEIRTVNHRYLEVKTRGVGLRSQGESLVNKMIRETLKRGSVFAQVRVTQLVDPCHIDRDVAKAVYKDLEALRQDLGLTEEVPLSLVLSQPGVRSDSEESDSLQPLLESAVKHALQEVLASRAEEGAKLATDLGTRLNALDDVQTELAALAKEQPEAHQQRVQEKLAELLANQSLSLDDARLAQEVAVLAERSDVTEELTRLSSHLAAFRKAIASDGPMGKRLNFLAQELGREINTVGSKAQDVQMSKLVIDAKELLEQLREQIQNIE